MVTCAVKNCENYIKKKRVGKSLKYFRFPRDPKVLSKWIKVSKNKANINVETARICSEHFEESDYELKGVLLNEPLSKRRLKPDAVPTKNLGSSVSNRNKIIREKKRLQTQRELVEQALSSYEQSKKDELDTLDVKLVNGTSQMLEIEILGPAELEELKELEELPEKSNQAVQTEIDIECAREFHIMTLETQLRKYQSAYRKVQNELNRVKSESENLNVSLSKFMTPGQLRKLRESNKVIKWKSQDMDWAKRLYSAGQRSYMLLRWKGYPLPCPSSITKWTERLKKVSVINPDN